MGISTHGYRRSRTGGAVEPGLQERGPAVPVLVGAAGVLLTYPGHPGVHPLWTGAPDRVR